jgi:HEAT repeat protein
MAKSFIDLLNQIAVGTPLQTGNLYALSRLGREALVSFQATWPTIPAPRRREIIQALTGITETNFEVNFDSVFLLGLHDDDPGVRAAAINGLWEYEKPTLIETLIRLLQRDEAETVRAAAAIALGRFVYLGEVEKIPRHQVAPARAALLEAIHRPGESVEVRRRAVESIAYVSEKEVVGIIESAYYDENELMQASAIFAMGRSADSRWVKRVISELEHPAVEIRLEAVRACGELEARAAVPPLIELLEDDPDLELQVAAIRALGRIGGNDARHVLEQYAAESEEETLARAAEEALDEINLFDGSLSLFELDEDDFDPDDDDY